MDRKVFLLGAGVLFLYGLVRLFMGLHYRRSDDPATRDKQWRAFGEFIVILALLILAFPVF